ncbi:autotransporter outer membrane beta-barrel domain-containing protein [Achromobacter aegrifaciens]
MNKIYRVVFNEVVGVWQAVAEVAAGRGKSSGKSAAQSVARASGVSAKSGWLALGLVLSGGAWADGGAGSQASIYPLAPGGVGGTSASPVGGDGTAWTSNPGGAQYPGQGSGGGGGAMYISGAGAGNGGGGGNGGNGGAGGAAGARSGSILTTSSTISANRSGGAGSHGADAPAKASGSGEAGGGGGGGGGGGAAAVSSNGTLTVNNGVQISGGLGGTGGAAGQLTASGWGNSSGAGGGQGGAAVLITTGAGGALNNNGGILTGGNAGAGGSGSPNPSQGGSYGGFGGDGGTAVLFSNASSGTVVNGGTLAGGGGGAVGQTTAGSAGERAGNGGAGLSGNNLGITNTGTIRGGVGGTGGQVPPRYPSPGQGGGGIVGNALTINNSGTVSGGNSGAILGGDPSVGKGGVGITGASLNVTNGGTIRGGLGADGTTRANAIVFTAGNNTLQINTGSDIQGNVVGATGAGTRNALNLGGTAVSSFAVSEIGAKYRDFGSFGKVGTGSWTLNGSTASLTPWTVSAGTLAISTDGSLGAESGGLTLDGGTLQTTANLSMARNVVIGSAGGTLNTNAATTLGLTGVVSGGALVKAGAGMLTLSGSNSYAGGTTVQGGTLSVASDASLGAAGGSLTLDGGRLQSTATISTSRAIAAGAAGGSFDPSAGTTLTLRGVVSGAGALTQAGAGTLVLAGDGLAYNGSVHVNAGTLAVNGAIGGNVQVHGGTLGGLGRIGGNVNVANGGTLSPGSSPGTLNIGGALALGSGATSIFQLGQSGAVGGVSNDLVQVGGDLALGGTLQASAASAGWYRLFEYGGALSGQFDTQQVSSTGGSFTVAGHQLDTSQNGQINLSVLGSGQTLQFWRGGPGDVWNGFTSAWVNDAPTNTTPTTSLGSVAVFGSDAGATPGTVTVQGPQSFDTLQFSANGYNLVADSSGATPGRLVMAPASGTQATINTDAGISVGISASIVDGAGNALLKVGGGTLTLSGANTYSGGTQVNEGLLVAGSHGALGSGAVMVDNGANRGATLQVASGVTLTNAITLNNGGTLDNAGTLAAAGTPVGAVTGAATVFNRAGATILGDVALNATGANAVSLFSGSHILGDLNIGSNTAASLTLDGSAPDQLYSQAVVGSTTFAGELVKNGSGGWTLDRALAPVSTTIHGGTLALRGAGDLGGGGVGLMASGAALDISAANGHRAIGWLSGVAGSSVELGTHTLTFGDASDQRFAGAIGGAGGLIKQGTGTQTLAGASTYSGGTELKAGRIDLGHSEALGSGVLAMDDGTTLGFVADGLSVANPIRMTGTNDPTFDTGAYNATLTGGISGNADLTKQGSGTLILAAANNSYSGATTVAAGTLRAGVANAFSTSSAMTIARGATLDLAGYDQRVAGISHSGTVSLMGRAPGATLTVTGPWVGQGGTLAVSTALGDNRSATDKVMLSGASAVASGNTQVAITNIGGLGGQTAGDGIEIVGTQNGASIQGEVFSLSAPVLAGAYEYQLHNTTSGAYLSSTSTAVQGPTSYRAEVPLYAALPEQLREANLAMLATLHRRVGDAGVANGGGATQGQRQAWARIVSIDREIGQGGAVSPRSEGRLTGFQAGTDLWADARWRAGLYVGQLDGDMKVTGFARGIDRYAAGRNELKNQYLGGYATYRNDDGLYVDGVLQGGRHRSTVGPDGFLSSQNKGHSLLASVEVGRSFKMASNWRIEPQLQLVHQRLSLNDSALVGAQVQQDPASSWAARIGVRVTSSIATAAGTVQPYARIDVWHSGSGTDGARFIGPAAATDISTPTGGTRTEAALGGHWQVSPNIGVYGELGQMWAAGGSVRTEGGPNASMGVQVRW